MNNLNVPGKRILAPETSKEARWPRTQWQAAVDLVAPLGTLQ